MFPANPPHISASPAKNGGTRRQRRILSPRLLRTLALAWVLGACSDPVTVKGVQQDSPRVEGFDPGNGSGLGFGVAPPEGEDAPPALAAVHFRQPPGFYTATFSLELDAGDADVEILYTLDGSLPDRQNAEDPGDVPNNDVVRRRTYRYLGPVELAPWLERPNQLSLIDTSTAESERGYRKWRRPEENVEKSVVVRVQAVAKERVSPVSSGTFFVDPRGRQRYSLPVLSLSTEPAFLFNQQDGLYVRGEDPSEPNFLERGDEWERPAYFELFDARGERPVAQWLGVRIHGDYSRGFPQKSLRLYARKEYGPSALQYPFFSSKPNAEFKRLLLRSGGNDWGRALFRDAAMQSLVHHLPLDTQHVQTAVVFINGEYWGLHEIRDRLDRFHVELHHGVPRGRVTILKNGARFSEGDKDDVPPFREFEGALAAGEFDTWDAVDSHVAVPEFLDYLSTETYAGNTDWPNKNVGWWRFSGPVDTTTRGPRDGRWRPMLYDVDRSLGNFDSTKADVVSRALGAQANRGAGPFFRGLIGVKAIRHDFIQRLAIHLETTFEPTRVGGVVEQFTQLIEPEMPEQIARWGYPHSMDDFYSHVEDAHEFAEGRPTQVRRHVVSFFDEVKGLAQVRIENIDPTRPPTLHGVSLSPTTPGVTLVDGTWQGTVFSGVPLVLAFQDYPLEEAVVEGASAQGSFDRLEVTLDPDSTATIRLPPLAEGNQGQGI